MGTPLDIDARRYYRVALQRLDDGSLMLEKLERPNAAVYLAGYAVECILKALLLESTPARQRSRTLRSFRGGIGHDLQWLLEQLRRRGVSLPPAVARDRTYVASWSVDLRYEPGPGDPEEAESFMRSTRAIVNWADGRL